MTAPRVGICLYAFVPGLVNASLEFSLERRDDDEDARRERLLSLGAEVAARAGAAGFTLQEIVERLQG